MMMNPPTLPSDYVPYVRVEELVTALENIRHATAPTMKDGAYHENAYSLADGVLQKVAARRAYEDKYHPPYLRAQQGAGDGNFGGLI